MLSKIDKFLPLAFMKRETQKRERIRKKMILLMLTVRILARKKLKLKKQMEKRSLLRSLTESGRSLHDLVILCRLRTVTAAFVMLRTSTGPPRLRAEL